MRRMLVAVAIIALAAAAFAQQDKDEEVRNILKSRTVTLSFSDCSIANIVSFLQDISGLNIVIDPKCDAELTTTVRLRDIKMENALKVMLQPLGLDYIVKDGVVLIATKKRIAELKGETKKKPADLEAGQLLLLLKDGSKLKGNVAVEKWKLKTAYGQLEIPGNEIRRIRFPHEAKEGEKTLEEDEVETVRFTVTGKLEIDKLELDTGKGKLSIPKKDIKEILFPRPVIEKSFEVKPTGEWLDTGVKLEKGDDLRVTAKGLINEEYTPDGEVAPLLGRIGKSGKEFRVGSAYSAKVKQEGNLYLRIQEPETAEGAEGSYKVKVKVQK